MKFYFRLLTILFVAGLALWLLPQAAKAATIKFNPSPVTVGLSETAEVQVVAVSSTSINSVEVEVSYPTDLVLAVEANAKGTVFPVTVFPPTRDNNTGRAKFTVAVTPPGYTGSNGVIGTIILKGQKLGTGKLKVASAKIIANDGSGTDVYTGSTDGDIVVDTSKTPIYNETGETGPVPIVTSTSHPDGSKWYNERNVSFSWEGGEVFNWVFDQDPETIPSTSSKGSGKSTVIGGVGDGVWYMHVRAAKGNTWGATTTFKVQIDGSAPPGFDLTFDPKVSGSSSALPLISFEADGAESGIDRYELSLDGGEFVRVRSPYQMPQVKPGKHTIEVKAIDNAGNETIARAELDVVPLGPKPTIKSPKAGAQLSIGDNNEFKGTAPPGSTVQLFANGQFVISAEANEKGEYTIKLSSQLEPGEYEFKVRAIKPGNLYSEFSDSVKAKVIPGGLGGGLAIGGFVIPFWITLIMYVVIIALLVGGLIWLFLRWRKARKEQKLALQKLELMTEADPASETPADSAPVDTGVGQESK